jgi:hypothetical protein
MTATRPDEEPDPHPDSPPSGPGGSPEHIDPRPDREVDPVEQPGPPDGDEIMRSKATPPSGAGAWRLA